MRAFMCFPIAVMRLEGLLCVSTFRVANGGTATLLWRPDIVEASFIYSFKKIQALMGAKCGHFLFDTFQVFSVI